MCSVYCRYDTDCVLRRLLKTDISSLGSHPTDNQLAKLQERTNALKRCIDNWQSIQLLFMPSVAWLRGEDVQPGEPAKVEEMKLFLPSKFCDRASCPNKLCEHEWKLREAKLTKLFVTCAIFFVSTLTYINSRTLMCVGKLQIPMHELPSVRPTAKFQQQQKNTMSHELLYFLSLHYLGKRAGKTPFGCWKLRISEQWRTFVKKKVKVAKPSHGFRRCLALLSLQMSVKGKASMMVHVLFLSDTAVLTNHSFAHRVVQS